MVTDVLPVNGEYTRESARPLVSLVFITPLLIIYELGVLWQGPQSVRNGAEVWLRGWLDGMGFGQYFLLPGLTCAVLLGWHHTCHERWAIRPSVLLKMCGECLVFAGLLLTLAGLQQRCFHAMFATASWHTDTGAAAARLIGYCGAGIYEELLFRVMLFPVVVGGLTWLGMSNRLSLIGGVILSSLAFSAAHYDFFSSAGEAFHWYSFSFRFAAGVFFASLFRLRGFGIAAGSHTLYDMLVEIV